MTRRSTNRSSNNRARALEHGRDSFRKQEWGAAFSQLSAADGEAPLELEDLSLLAQAALLIGQETEAVDLLTRLHQACLRGGDLQGAVRYALWLGRTFLFGGEPSKAGGWLSRASRLLDGQPACVEEGYLFLPTGYRAFHEGDVITAHAAFVQAAAIGERFNDKDLVALGIQGQGRALIRQGKISDGVALLDEAMIAVTAGEVSPLNAGAVYCSVIDACGEIFDLHRAQEWTSALEKWCATQPDLVPYRGHCLIRRAELLQLQGAWNDALEWAERACEWLSRATTKPDIGEAFYQVAEVHRVRGKFAQSEEAYREASRWYRSKGPGLAQLRLAQGQVELAMAAIRTLVEEVQEPGPRARVLDAYVEIALAANDIPTARAGAGELAEIVARHDTKFLRALCCRASGAVLLAEGNWPAALLELRQAAEYWSELEAPYEASRVRVLIALACRKLRDEENARLELTAARQTFQRLGAPVELARVDALFDQDEKATGPLTERELQVLRLVAAGMTNRGIAEKLHISEKTVARHISNIFTKLDLASRTAAAAYAYDHNLV